jgi:hypothetical protein
MTAKQALIQHYEHRLGTPTSTLTDRAGHLIVTPLRDQLDELRCCRPFWALGTKESFVLSVSPRIADEMPLALSNFTFESLIEDELRAELQGRIERKISLRSFHVESELFCTFDLFKPQDGGEVRPVEFEELKPDAALEPALRRILEIPLRDGDVYGLFEEGRIVSCAWIKRFSVYAWNVCVLSRARTRRMAWDAQALSAVIRRTLELGKVVIMNVPETNVPAIRLAHHLGFRMFGRSLLAVSNPMKRR